MATRALVNARALVDDGFRDDLAVLLDDGGDIAALVPASQARTQADEVDDLAGGWLAPGFIDAQVNGGGGVLFNNDTSVEAIAAIGRAHRRFGTTGFLPTLISDDAEVMARAIDATRAAIAAGVPGVLGVHLEGPYIAPARKGTHDAGKFRVPDVAEVAMATSLDNGVTLITLAPEQVPLETIRAMVGADDPAFALYGEVITAVDGVVRNAAGALAGSALDMATAVRNCVRLLGLPLDEAARMASTYPADFLGLGGRCGRIAAGLQADLVLLDESLAVRSTWIAGVREDVA